MPDLCNATMQIHISFHMDKDSNCDIWRPQALAMLITVTAKEVLLVP